MNFFKLTKKIRAPRYLIATSLMINSSSILDRASSLWIPVRFERSRHALQSSAFTVNIGARHVLDVVLPIVREPNPFFFNSVAPERVKVADHLKPFSS